MEGPFLCCKFSQALPPYLCYHLNTSSLEEFLFTQDLEWHIQQTLLDFRPLLALSSERMKQPLTTKLKLKTTSEQFLQVRAIQLAYRDALNFVSRYAYEHGKTGSNLTMHREWYQELRARFHLPSQVTGSVIRDVAASYKGLWTRLQKNLDGATQSRLDLQEVSRVEPGSEVCFSHPDVSV